MPEEKPERVDAYLVAGGRFHDIDYARLELLKLLSEHPYIRVKVGSDYEDTASITSASMLISYTCDIRPSENAQIGIRDWVNDGGRWLALHGTNSALDFDPPNPVGSPRCFRSGRNYSVASSYHTPNSAISSSGLRPDHWLVEGIEPLKQMMNSIYANTMIEIAYIPLCKQNGKAKHQVSLIQTGPTVTQFI
ncbi:MAG: hypothetical protein CM15mP49_33540 [Actinomycetota bacterium]|nr:MAG: hypothetical protein CM15mP49_33540 [Actinomycetota bacterium]